MSDQKLLTVRDVAITLGITEKDVINLAESGEVPAYKIGGVFLRFKKEQVQEFQKSSKNTLVKSYVAQKYTFKDMVKDFFYFNDFYIVAILIIVLLIVVIFQGS